MAVCVPDSCSDSDVRNLTVCGPGRLLHRVRDPPLRASRAGTNQEPHRPHQQGYNAIRGAFVPHTRPQHDPVFFHIRFRRFAFLWVSCESGFLLLDEKIQLPAFQNSGSVQLWIEEQEAWSLQGGVPPHWTESCIRPCLNLINAK